MTNTPFKTITGVSVSAAVIFFITYGERFFHSLGIAFDFLFAISAKAPLGVWSFFASVAAATIMWLALQKWIPETRNRWSRSFSIDIVSAAVGALAGYLQQPTAQGLLWCILAGFFATYPARGLMALGTWIGHRWLDSSAPPGP